MGGPGSGPRHKCPEDCKCRKHPWRPKPWVKKCQKGCTCHRHSAERRAKISESLKKSPYHAARKRVRAT